jgi:hypothetical protein
MCQAIEKGPHRCDELSNISGRLPIECEAAQVGRDCGNNSAGGIHWAAQALAVHERVRGEPLQQCRRGIRRRTHRAHGVLANTIEGSRDEAVDIYLCEVRPDLRGAVLPKVFDERQPPLDEARADFIRGFLRERREEHMLGE